MLYGPRQHQQRVQGLRRHVRGDEQRRCRGALRPARRPLADRDADLQAGGGAARPACRLDRRGPGVPEPAGPPGPARAGGLLEPPPARRLGRGADAACAGRRQAAAPATAPQGPYAMCYAVSTGPDPFGPVLPLRVPPAALPRLPAAGHLARRLLRADEHRRRPDLRDHRDAEARLRRRPRADAARRAGRRAVRRPEQRRLPEQRGRRRHGACRRRARRTS
ncbi:MAG: hypothetical protein MZV63_23960 [Marinilabiliales bacterium]|nr:hypothetical protein [Marinilabiliales bacterium]